MTDLFPLYRCVIDFPVYTGAIGYCFLGGELVPPYKSDIASPRIDPLSACSPKDQSSTVSL